MMKYLLLFAFLAAVWWVWSKRHSAAGTETSERREPAPEKMVTCVHCGVHLPESEGIVDGDRVYCSEAHRLAASSSER
ncbi:MAG: PP0621 family protein [Pseudomonadota bacterium]